MLRFNPQLAKEGKNPLQLDSRPPVLALDKYIYNETRYTMLAHSNPEAARLLLKEAEQEVMKRWKLYEHWATMPGSEPVQESKENKEATVEEAKNA